MRILFYNFNVQMYLQNNGVLTLSNIHTLFRIDVLFLSVSAQQGGLAFLLLLFVGVLVVDLNVEIPELPTHLGLLEKLVLLFFSFCGNFDVSFSFFLSSS